MRSKQIPITSIRLDGDTQPRKELDQLVVDEYAESYAAGVDMPPIDVFHDGTDYWLADGFHRWFGARNAKLDKIACIVHTGTLQDARWFSYAANQKHGLRRTNSDKAKAVRQALKHPNGAKLSDSQIAEHVGVNDKTVAKYRAELAASSEIPKMDTRTVRRGDQEYEQNTSNIGKAKPKHDEFVKEPTRPFDEDYEDDSDIVEVAEEDIEDDDEDAIDVAPERPLFGFELRRSINASPHAKKMNDTQLAAALEVCIAVLRTWERHDLVDFPMMQAQLGAFVADLHDGQFDREAR